MKVIGDIAALEALYGVPGEAATVKVTARLTPAYLAWIERARFCILTTVGPEGTDASPRGDDGPVVRVLDAGTLALPDWRGNDRIDSLRNIVRDGRVSLMFMVPGANNVIRVNGRAVLTADDGVLGVFERDGKRPRSVAVVTIAEVYSQCARALIRSALWTSGDQSAGLPSVGDMLREITQGGIDGAAYDAAWPGRAAATMW
ncbi:MAG: pyridoxamine 5'-phosphate oxidase family protein [Paracoccaceae bacterium]